MPSLDLEARVVDGESDAAVGDTDNDVFARGAAAGDVALPDLGRVFVNVGGGGKSLGGAVIVVCCRVRSGGSMRRLVQCVLVAIAISSFVGILAANAEVQGRNVTSASIGTDGLIHILRSNGTEFIAPPEATQVSVEAPVIAEDGRTVGWLVNFPNCCTSYPIPLALVIYRDGQILHRISPSVLLPLVKWIFTDTGSRVAYYSETVHGGMNRRCELREVASGKLLDEWYPGKSKTLPKWAEQFAQDLAPLKDAAPN